MVFMMPGPTHICTSVLKDPDQGSLSFLFFLLAVVSVLCNHLD